MSSANHHLTPSGAFNQIFLDQEPVDVEDILEDAADLDEAVRIRGHPDKKREMEAMESMSLHQLTREGDITSINNYLKYFGHSLDKRINSLDENKV